MFCCCFGLPLPRNSNALFSTSFMPMGSVLGNKSTDDNDSVCPTSFTIFVTLPTKIINWKDECSAKQNTIVLSLTAGKITL